MQWWIWVILIIGGYLLGSIPTGYLLVRATKGIDIRKIGSGNVGTTNSARAAGKTTGLLVFIADTLKGFIPTLIGSMFSPELAIAAGTAAFLGHLWPVWLNFSGGKGVATLLGVALVFYPLTALASFASWSILLLVIGYVSIASCLATLIMPILTLIIYDDVLISAAIAAMVVLVWIRHISNFRNIMAGTEDRKFRKVKPAPAREKK
jgi:glycerol-3-phosphate acyltransferase PlsY